MVVDDCGEGALTPGLRSQGQLGVSGKRLRTRRHDATKMRAADRVGSWVERRVGGAATRLVCGVQGEACEGHRSDDEAASGWVRLVIPSAECPGQSASAPYLSRTRLVAFPLPESDRKKIELGDV